MKYGCRYFHLPAGEADRVQTAVFQEGLADKALGVAKKGKAAGDKNARSLGD